MRMSMEEKYVRRRQNLALFVLLVLFLVAGAMENPMDRFSLGSSTPSSVEQD
jgi:hypothetical protein